MHGDHCYGLPGLIASANMSGRTEPLLICAPDGIQQMLEAIFKLTDVHLRFELQFVRSDTADFLYEDKHLKVSSVALSHRVPCFAYVAHELGRRIGTTIFESMNIPKGPMWGMLQKGENVTLEDGREIKANDLLNLARRPRKIIVGGDNDQPKILESALVDCDVFIHEATFTEDVLAKVGPKYQHSTAKMVAEQAEQSKTPNLILTHFSQRYGRRKKTGSQSSNSHHTIDTLASEASDVYSGNLYLASDLDSYQLNTKGELSLVQA